MMNNMYDVELQARLEQYNEEMGSQRKAAAAIGLSASTISQYRRGMYDKGDIAEITNRLKAHFSVLDAQMQQPSHNSPLRIEGEYVPTSTSERIYKTIRYCQLERGITITHGDAGIGKTRAAAKFVQDNPNSAIYLEATPVTGTLSRFIKLLAREFGISTNMDKMDMIDKIKEKLLGTSKVLIIDEAQHLKYLTLEEIRNWTMPHPITGQSGIGIVLIGNSQIHTRMVGKQEAQFAQQFSRSRPYRYSTQNTTRTDIEMMFPVLKERQMDKEIEFLLRISNSKWALRSAVCIWNDAVNAEDVSYKNLKAFSQSRGIGLV